MIPNTFIIGAPKCGTSTVANWLSKNRDCCVAKTKESNYWRNEYHKGIQHYIDTQFYHHMGETVIVDASTINLVLRYSAERIFRTNENAKIIVCIRNPWERAFSHWSMLKSWRPGRVRNRFIDEMKANLKTFNPYKFSVEGDFVPYLEEKGECYLPTLIEQGIYEHSLNEYEKFFQENEIHIISLKDIKDNGVATYKRLCEFLEIEPEKTIDPICDPNTKTKDVFNIKQFDAHTFREINDIFQDCNPTLKSIW